MTTSNNKKTDQAPNTDSKQGNQDTPTFGEGSANMTHDTQTQAMAYLFGLLPSQDSQQFERQIEEDASCKGVLDEARGFQDILSYWTDVPAPSSLSDRTLSFIQEQVEEEKVGTAGGSGPSV